MFRPEVPVGTPTLQVPEQAAPAARPAAPVPDAEEGGFLPALGRQVAHCLSLVLGSSPALLLPSTGEGEEGEELAYPPGSGMLDALAPLNLNAVEQGLEQFLARLGPGAISSAGDEERADLAVWIAAGAATVAACEITRRQLRRPEGEAETFPGLSPSPFVP